MARTYWPLALGITAIAIGGIFVLAEHGSAQPRDVVPSEAAGRAELARINRIPASLVERARIADLAVGLNFPGASERDLHVLHAQLLAPQFDATVPSFLAYPLGPIKKIPCAADTIYSHGHFPTIIPKSHNDADAGGCEGTDLPAGPITASTNAFFQSLGTNKRSCATCHQPPSAMSVSTANINARFAATNGHDPIFASVDGANCPSHPNDHSLLLRRGVFRIFEPLPAGAQFTVSAVGHDPSGCNTVPPYNTDTVAGQTVQMISVYRRPRISASLNFVAATVPPGPPPTPAAPAAIMWDTRENSFQQQAIDATHGHAQGVQPPSTGQVTQIVDFETNICSAQSSDHLALSLAAGGATGGPVNLCTIAAATTSATLAPATTPQISFTEYNAWAANANARRASISRGETLFNTKPITISNVAGLNDVPGLPSPFSGTCSGCHSQVHAGNEDLGSVGVLDIGIDGASAAHNGNPTAHDLPIFTVTCTGGSSTPFNGSTVTTNDLGLALKTGRCADIGKYSAPQLRGLDSRAPYFHDGSAKTLWEVVEFYNKRFAIKLTSQEKQDLVNFLAAL